MPESIKKYSRDYRWARKVRRKGRTRKLIARPRKKSEYGRGRGKTRNVLFVEKSREQPRR